MNIDWTVTDRLTTEETEALYAYLMRHREQADRVLGILGTLLDAARGVADSRRAKVVRCGDDDPVAAFLWESLKLCRVCRAHGFSLCTEYIAIEAIGMDRLADGWEARQVFGDRASTERTIERCKECSTKGHRQAAKITILEPAEKKAGAGALRG